MNTQRRRQLRPCWQLPRQGIVALGSKYGGTVFMGSFVALRFLCRQNLSEIPLISPRKVVPTILHTTPPTTFMDSFFFACASPSRSSSACDLPKVAEGFPAQCGDRPKLSKTSSDRQSVVSVHAQLKRKASGCRSPHKLLFAGFAQSALSKHPCGTAGASFA